MNATPSRIVFVGVATQDAIAVVERYPGADERVVADDVLFAGGGPAATAAVAAARLGIAVALVAAVGDDEAGRKVIHDLHGEGVDVSGIAMVPGARTALSLVVISGPENIFDQIYVYAWFNGFFIASALYLMGMRLFSKRQTVQG